jgi:DNA-binding transcriptional ArsR family regulator
MAHAHPDPGRVFAALADARRRELLEILAREPGMSAGGLAAVLPVSRQAVAQHLAVLEEARLVTRRRAGRQVLFTVRPEGLTATADWLTTRAAAWGTPKFRADQEKDTLL